MKNVRPHSFAYFIITLAISRSFSHSLFCSHGVNGKGEKSGCDERHQHHGHWQTMQRTRGAREEEKRERKKTQLVIIFHNLVQSPCTGWKKCYSNTYHSECEGSPPEQSACRLELKFEAATLAVTLRRALLSPSLSLSPSPLQSRHSPSLSSHKYTIYIYFCPVRRLFLLLVLMLLLLFIQLSMRVPSRSLNFFHTRSLVRWKCVCNNFCVMLQKVNKNL